MNNEYNMDICNDFMPTLCRYLREMMHGNAKITTDNYCYIYNTLIVSIDLELWRMYLSNNKPLHDIAKVSIMNDLYNIADNIRHIYGNKFKEEK